VAGRAEEDWGQSDKVGDGAAALLIAFGLPRKRRDRLGRGMSELEREQSRALGLHIE
jgi:hypothetical protein